MPPQRCSWPFHHLNGIQHHQHPPSLRSFRPGAETLTGAWRGLGTKLSSSESAPAGFKIPEVDILNRLTSFNHPNEQNLLAWQSGSSPRQLAPLNLSLGKWTQKHGKSIKFDLVNFITNSTSSKTLPSFTAQNWWNHIKYKPWSHLWWRLRPGSSALVAIPVTQLPAARSDSIHSP